MKDIRTEYKENFLRIEIPYSLIYENRSITEFIKYLGVKKIISKSQATDEDIKKLSHEIKRKIWEETQDWFLNE